MSEDRWKGLTAFIKNPAGAALLAMLATGLLVLMLTGKLTWAQLTGHGEDPQSSALTEKQARAALAAVIRQDVTPRQEALEAGFKALVGFQKPEVRVAVLQNMLDAREKAQRAASFRDAKDGQP
jgi:hypothetical protein